MGIFDMLFGRRKKCKESESEIDKWKKTWEREHAVMRRDTLAGTEIVISSYAVSRQSVLTGNMHDVDVISRMAIADIQQHGIFQPCNMTISGYDDDPRHLCEIPEIRTWCKNVYIKAPYLPCLFSENTIGWYVLCLLEIETVGGRRRSLLPREQSMIEDFLRVVGQKDPQAAERMRESFEWEKIFHIKSSEDACRLLAEVGKAGIEFVKQRGVNAEVARQILIEGINRITRVLTV